MFHTIARLREKGDVMKRESNRCNGLEHVPPCSTWPPPWLAEVVQPAPLPPPCVAAALKLPAVSPSELPPDLYERWEERAGIRQFDGGFSLKEAEALALEDVLRHAEGSAGLATKIAKAEEAAAVVQATLFGGNGHAGPYGRGF